MGKNELTTPNSKLSLEEYISTYNSKPQNSRAIRTFLFLFTSSIGIVILSCIILLDLRLFEIHNIAGIVGAVIGALVFLFIYIIPVLQIKKSKAFITNVDATNAREAKKFNKKLREDIADKMIDFAHKTENVGWYSDEKIGHLAVARQTKDDEDLKLALTNIYDTDVRNAANRIIREHALKVGFATALSQSDKLDTMFVSLYELNLIKELVLLYGYRPSDAKLARIYKNVIANSLIAYGAQTTTTSIANGVVNKLGDAANKIPVLGAVIGTVIESASQGAINASLTVVIGFQTKRYLKKEYKLQDILDNVDVADDTDEASEAEMLDDVKKNVLKKENEKKPAFAR